MDDIKEESYVMFLPSEVLENIFNFLDGRSFCNAREVCKTWNEIIKGLQVKKNLWRQFCVKEISKSILEEIVWFKNISCCDIEWKSVYKKWFQSKLILTSPFYKRKICAFLPNPITCIAVSGSWILTGHSNGMLCTWNLHKVNLHKSFVCHLRIINDMALVDLLNLGSYYGAENFPWAHHHVITISKDQYIHVTSLLEPPPFVADPDAHQSPHGDDLKQVRVFGDTFAISCRDNTVSLWKMEILKEPYFHLSIALVQKIIGPEDILLSIGLWHSEVQCVSYAGKLRALSANRSDWVEKKYFKESYSDSRCENIVSVTVALLYRSKTVIMLTADGKLVVSVSENNNRHYYPMRHLRTSVVSVALHGTILALGGENGKLFLYHINSEEELIQLNLSNPALTLSLSEASIISIYISFQDDSPVIAASTTNLVYVIKWYKPSSNQVKTRQIIQWFEPD